MYAQELAEEKQPLCVIFNMVPSFLGATKRQYGFMTHGLINVEKNLKQHNIPMYLLMV